MPRFIRVIRVHPRPIVILVPATLGCAPQHNRGFLRGSPFGESVTQKRIVGIAEIAAANLPGDWRIGIF
jgi:hypothetical protein